MSQPERVTVISDVYQVKPRKETFFDKVMDIVVLAPLVFVVILLVVTICKHIHY